MKTNLPMIAVAALMLHTFVFKAQQGPVFQEATLARPADLWHAVKFDNSTNIKNGVHFYSHAGECAGGKVSFMKLVNTNSYPVTFTYQVSESSPVVSVTVPASFSVEGSCATADANLAKLTIPASAAKRTEEEIKASAAYMKSHMDITPVQ